MVTEISVPDWDQVKSCDLSIANELQRLAGGEGKQRLYMRPSALWEIVLQTVPVKTGSGSWVAWESFVSTLKDSVDGVSVLYDPKAKQAFSALQGNPSSNKIVGDISRIGRKQDFNLVGGNSYVSGRFFTADNPSTGNKTLHRLAADIDLTGTPSSQYADALGIPIYPILKNPPTADIMVDFENWYARGSLITVDRQYSDDVKTFTAYTLGFLEFYG